MRQVRFRTYEGLSPFRAKEGEEKPGLTNFYFRPYLTERPILDLTSNWAMLIQADQAVFRAVPGQNERALNLFRFILCPRLRKSIFVRACILKREEKKEGSLFIY
jgi:hypothetical protein